MKTKWTFLKAFFIFYSRARKARISNAEAQHLHNLQSLIDGMTSSYSGALHRPQTVSKIKTWQATSVDSDHNKVVTSSIGYFN